MSNEPIEINDKGSKIWRNSKGQFHRDNDLPAVVRIDGTCAWFQNNQYHRDNDLPAIIYPGGTCSWYENDLFIMSRKCTSEEIEQYKKPYYLQKSKKIQFSRFENLIKDK